MFKYSEVAAKDVQVVNGAASSGTSRTVYLTLYMPRHVSLNVHRAPLPVKSSSHGRRCPAAAAARCSCSNSRKSL
jgi:hypothetical protein